MELIVGIKVSQRKKGRPARGGAHEIKAKIDRIMTDLGAETPSTATTP